MLTKNWAYMNPELMMGYHEIPVAKYQGVKTGYKKVFLGSDRKGIQK